MRGRLVLGTVLAAGAQLSSLALLLTSGWLIVRAAQQPPVLYLLVAVTSVRMFGVARAAMRYAERLLTHDVVLGRVIDTRVAAYRALDRVAPAGLAGRRHGDVVQRVVRDVERTQDRLLRIRIPWISGVATIVVVIAVVTWLLPSAGAVLLVQTLVVALLVRWWVPRAVRRRAAPEVALAAGATELARLAPDLLAYGSSRGRAEAAHTAVDGLAARGRHDAWTHGAASALVLVSSALGGVAIALLAAGAGVPAVVVGVLVLAPVGLVEVLDSLVEAERHRPEVEDAERRLRELAGLEPPVSDPAAPAPDPTRHDLELEDVAVGWDGDAVAQGLTATLPMGQVLLVTGPSGSGKSTLAAALLRLITPLRGTIRLGGVDVQRLSGESVRRRIGMLGQDEPVFDTTIRENLRVAAPEASDDQLFAALRRAGLLDLVVGLPDGLDTPVGEGGNRLSGGERQRLALARLLLADHDVLVLDEPTEHLDEPTARSLLDDVAALVGVHSLVVVTHSPAVLERFAGARRLELGTPSGRPGLLPAPPAR